MAKKSVRKTVEEKLDVVEEPVENKVSTPQEWQMPKPKRGDMVLFYPRSVISESNSEVAFVTNVHNKSLKVVVGVQGHDDVYHKDDPRIERNPDLKIEIPGVWDFMESKSLRDRVIELEERVAKLEG